MRNVISQNGGSTLITLKLDIKETSTYKFMPGFAIFYALYKSAHKLIKIVKPSIIQKSYKISLTNIDLFSKNKVPKSIIFFLLTRYTNGIEKDWFIYENLIKVVPQCYIINIKAVGKWTKSWLFENQNHNNIFTIKPGTRWISNACYRVVKIPIIPQWNYRDYFSSNFRIWFTYLFV